MFDEEEDTERMKKKSPFSEDLDDKMTVGLHRHQLLLALFTYPDCINLSWDSLLLFLPPGAKITYFEVLVMRECYPCK